MHVFAMYNFILFQTKMILVKDGSGQGGALAAVIEKKRQTLSKKDQ